MEDAIHTGWLNPSEINDESTLFYETVRLSNICRSYARNSGDIEHEGEMRRLSLATAACSFILVGSAATAPAQTPQPTKSSNTATVTAQERGLTLLNRGLLSEAEAEFSRALEDDPKALRAILGLADIALRRKQLQVAERWASEALTQYPDRTEAMIGAARVHQAKGEHDQAIVLLERAAAHDTKSQAALLDLADIYFVVKRRPDLAEQKFRAAIAIDPRNPSARHGRALVLMQQLKLIEARKEAAEAVRLMARNSAFQLTLSRIDRALGRPDDALKAADAAIALDARSADAQVARGDALLGKKDLPRALQAFEAALRIDPKQNHALTSIGMIHQLAGRWPEAEKSYRQALALQPDQAPILNNIAWMLAEQRRDLDSALAQAKRATQLAPQFGPYQDTLGWVYRARGDLRAAAAALETATSLPAPSPETYVRLARVYREAGDKNRALTALERALALSPGLKEALDAKQQLQTN